MDFIFEVFLEIFVRVYLNFTLSLIPDKKLKKWQIYLLVFLAFIVSIVIIFFTCFGILLLITAKNQNEFYTGLGLTISALLLFTLQLTLYFITKNKEKKLKKQKSHERMQKKLLEQKKDTSHELIIEPVKNENKQD